MDMFSIGGALWRHKWVSIPLALLTVLGMLYVLALKAPVYQAKADILLANPPAPPTAFQIDQDPSLAKMNNPLVNLGDLTYVAEVLIDSVTAPAAEQELAKTGASGYQVVLDNASQTNIPPAIDVVGTGPSPQAATRNAQFVATAIASDLVQLQASQHVRDKYMITSVEYVRPDFATKSSGNLETAAGVAAVGLIVLLVGVSMAQGRAEQKNSRSRRERQAGYRETGDFGLADSETQSFAGESRRSHGGPQPAMHMSDPAGSGRWPAQPSNGGTPPWGQNG